MRILYFLEWSPYRKDGVTKKVITQARRWIASGHEVKVLCLGPREPGEPSFPEDIAEIVSYSRVPWGLSKVMKSIAAVRVKRIASQFQANIIYYRQSSWTPGVIWALGKKAPVVVEINSDAKAEARMAGRLTYAYYLATHWILERKAAAFLSLSHELAERISSSGDRPVAVIGNGIDLISLESAEIVGVGSLTDRPQLVFAGTPNQPWAGVDLLLNLAWRLPEYDFHVAGDRDLTGPPNLFLHGYLNFQELGALLQRMDVGISTLALFRKGMNEASPLKSREYLSHGLPLIGGYQDTDLSGREFYLQIANTQTGAIDGLSDIREFVSKWHKRRVALGEIESLISSEVKERARLQFLTDVLGGWK